MAKKGNHTAQRCGVVLPAVQRFHTFHSNEDMLK